MFLTQKASLLLKSLTIFATGVINRKETSHKTSIRVRPENPVLVPFDWTTTTVRIVHEQTVVLDVTDGRAELKSRANNFSSHWTEKRRQTYAGRQSPTRPVTYLLGFSKNWSSITERNKTKDSRNEMYKLLTATLATKNSVAYQVRNNIQQFWVMVYFFKGRMNHRR